MNFDIKFFKKLLKEGTYKVIEKIKESNEIDKICSFSLYSDSSAMTACVSFNDYDFLKEQQTLYPDYANDYKWSPGSWHYEDTYGEYIDAASDMLSEASDVQQEENYHEFSNEVFEAFVSVLENLKLEGVFNIFGEDFILLFTVSDWENKDKQSEWVKRLNNDEVSNEYIKWLNS